MSAEEAALIVLCDQPHAVPKERVEISVELPANHGLDITIEPTEKPRKRRKVASSKLEISLRLATMASGVGAKVKIDAVEPKNVALPLKTAESRVLCTGRIDFDPLTIGLTNCMACIEVATTIGGRRVTGQTRPFMLCNYQVFFTEVKPQVVEGGLSYSINCVLIAYGEDESRAAHKPIRVSVIDDAGLSVPEGQATWHLSDTSSTTNAPALTITTDKNGDALFNVFVAEKSPYIKLVGGVIRFHLTCDWVQSRDLYATVPASSRRICPENDIIQDPTVPLPEVTMYVRQCPIPPPAPIMQQLVIPGGNGSSVEASQNSIEIDRTVQPNAVADESGLVQKEPSLQLDKDGRHPSSIAHLDDKTIRRLGWFPYGKDEIVYCRQCFVCKSRLNPLDGNAHRQSCGFSSDSSKMDKGAIIPDLVSMTPATFLQIAPPLPII